jgi:hypothetical protein
MRSPVVATCPGNAGLALNVALGCPVRVVRGTKAPDGATVYVYDGLYRVERYWRKRAGGAPDAPRAGPGEPDPPGAAPLVFVFALRRMPGAQLSTAPAARVAFRALHKTPAAFRIALAASTRAARAADRAAAAADGAQAQRMAIVRRRAGFILDDVSHGAEAVPIPVFDETRCTTAASHAAGAAPAPDPAPLPVFTYVRDCATAVSAAAAAVAAAAPAVASPPRDAGAASAASREAADDLPVPAEEAYIDGAFLCQTEPGGVLESAPDCAVSAGVRLPLEVFRCAEHTGKGWGARCAARIYEGEFVVEYGGECITAAEAAARGAVSANSEYVFSLDHFHRDAAGGAEADDDDDVAPPGLLCVDAHAVGNVARCAAGGM